MAYAVNTLNGLIQLNDANLADIEGVTDLFDGSTFVERIFTQPASQKTLHKYLKQTVAAGSAFRAVNAGVANAPSQDELITVTLALLDGGYYVDKAIADTYAGGMDAFMTRETLRHLRAAYFDIESQIFYGTGHDGTGFAGLNVGRADLDDAMVVNATGTGSGTIKTSCWLIRSNRDAVSLALGNDGKMVITEPYLTQVLDGSTNPFDAYRVSMLGYLGLQVGSSYDACRIVNITNESGKGLTDDLIASGISKFMASKQPNYIVCNRTALGQLRNSRTATNQTGAPAPFPVEAFGIPIIVTDAILDSESIITS
jgi:hypothetical protein